MRNTTKTGSSSRSKMLAAILLGVLGVATLSAIALAQSNNQNSGNDPTNSTMPQHLVASGVGVSTTNSTTDVSLFRTIIVQAGNRTFGLLKFNGEVYKLQNVVFGNGTVTADIFSRELNQTVGSLSLQIQNIANEMKNVVTGTVTLNGTNYNIYAVQTNIGHTFGHFENETAENES